MRSSAQTIVILTNTKEWPRPKKGAKRSLISVNLSRILGGLKNIPLKLLNQHIQVIYCTQWTDRLAAHPSVIKHSYQLKKLSASEAKANVIEHLDWGIPHPYFLLRFIGRP